MNWRRKKLTKSEKQSKIRNSFILNKKNKEIKERIIRDIWMFYKTEKEK